MKYMGSKSRITKFIIPILQSYINENNIVTYVEPFVGGANVVDKIQCETKIASDINPYLVALLVHVQNGRELYKEVTKDIYDAARTAFNNKDTSEYEDWEIGNIGFLASYNGRFFDGGYAKTGYEKTKKGLRLRNYYEEAKNNILSQSENLKGITFLSCDYRSYTNLTNCLIYVDPPYRNTKQYQNSLEFNYDEFWDVMREWSKNNIVIISEQEAPADFECIWEQEVSRSIKATDKSKATEKLFILRKE